MELIFGNEASASNISVFPNPVSPGNPLHIKMPFEKAAVDMINSAVEIMHSFQLDQSESSIYIGPFVSGKYYFRFTTQSTSIIKPVLLL
jgi:hypothetical protein